jgi:hypothetical protein
MISLDARHIKWSSYRLAVCLGCETLKYEFFRHDSLVSASTHSEADGTQGRRYRTASLRRVSHSTLPKLRPLYLDGLYRITIRVDCRCPSYLQVKGEGWILALGAARSTAPER